MSAELYNDYSYSPSQISHNYGSNIHLVTDPVALSRLALLGSPETMQPTINNLIVRLYQQLLVYVAGELAASDVKVATRMTGTSGQKWSGRIIDASSPVVIAGIARAGTLPAETVFADLCQILDPRQVRIDHLYMARAVDGSGAVCGTNLSGHKIGGPVDGATLLIPDPMGATGGTIVKTLEIYKKLGLGTPRRVVPMHLIITPEYIAKVRGQAPDLSVYALRLDRGLSSAKALAARPGTYPDEERGLNEHDYIIPGLGGVGEIMSNSFV